MRGLHRSDPSSQGIRRLRKGRGFSFVDERGQLVEGAQKERIRLLAIPPAWTEVWISPKENGHIQVTGKDAEGRTQYIYHSAWSKRKGNEKHVRAAELGQRIASLRRSLRRTVRSSKVEKSRILALILLLIDQAHLRVGNQADTDSHKSYGASTLLCRHCEVDRNTVTLKFTGKSHQPWKITVSDPLLVKNLTALCSRPSSERLFVYQADNELRSVSPSAINEYLRKTAGGTYQAKDFRTWHGTITAARFLALKDPRKGTEKNIRLAYRTVSQELHNTPAVASSSYVDPRLISAFRSGKLFRLKVTDKAVAQLLRK